MNKQQQARPRPGEEMWAVWDEKIKSSFPRARALSTQALHDLLQAQAPEHSLLLLDVRGEPEFSVSQLHPLAIRFNDSADLSEVHALLRASPGEKKMIVCYCSIGFRSSRLAQRLVDSNEFTGHEIFNLEGGLFQWANENRELVKPVAGKWESTEGAHPYNATFGQMLDQSLHRYPEKSSVWQKLKSPALAAGVAVALAAVGVAVAVYLRK